MMKIENEDDITLTHIKGNWRYKVFRYRNKTYILDGSTYLISLFLPILNWYLLPINGYEINDAILEELEEVHSVKKLDIGWGIIFTIMVLSSFFAKLVHKIVSNFSLPKNFNIIYLYMIPTIFIGYFTISRCFKKRKLFSLLNEEYNKKRIRFKLPFEENKKVWKKILIGFIILIIVCFEGILYSLNLIIAKSPDVRDYIMYFILYLVWSIMAIGSAVNPEHLENATITVEDK
ncbi:MAG TPA: DUF443 family protein [Tissierellales bacterium]|nr:DUF443 family protein [Tissierellales bacterium]